ncbi:DUF808 domain-containing protein [Chitinophaga parva]|uniref:DUF808 domain-containing protein n=1 Tax=Chitinophaga parva TaxID=2169414 RepID=A0A2T7BGW6_9BACT|nr:DUF808 family protein [Chitinophaga parva]PUZ25518.1 DUF808 domain-containing protein [Chitinophaga parva]
MASGIFAILDDIAALMDDISVTAKVATQKTAGILGDDLAVNAEKATGFVSSRELPVLWAITKGSLLNKLIIIPIALLLNAFVPVAMKIALVLGGFYLAYEGVEKIIEFLFHRSHEKPEPVTAATPQQPDLVAEKGKVKAAIATDFILSIEIVIISLGSVLDKPLATQALTVAIVGVLATAGVYGIVALIVRMDDAGFGLIRRSRGKGIFAAIGRLLVKALPVIIRILAVVGTLALVLVSGGIFVHNIEYLHHVLPGVPAFITELIMGLVAGLVMVGMVNLAKRIVRVVKER